MEVLSGMNKADRRGWLPYDFCIDPYKQYFSLLKKISGQDSLYFYLIFNSVLMKSIDCRIGNKSLKNLNESGCTFIKESVSERRIPYVGRLAPTPSGYMHGQ